MLIGLLVMEDDGRVSEFVGGYSDYLAHGAAAADERARASKPETSKSTKPRRDSQKGLSYYEQRELDSLPERIEALESRLAELTEKAGDPALYREPGAKRRR